MKFSARGLREVLNVLQAEPIDSAYVMALSEGDMTYAD